MSSVTTRTLVLLRHAKAEDPDAYPEDIDRPLTPRGLADAAAAGQWLRDGGFVPDLVVCSAAVRTRETWKAASARLGGAIPIVYEQSLYLAGFAEALELVRQTEPTVASLLVIGHNPTVSVLSAMLDPDGGGSAEGLPTAGMAVHRFDHVWRELDAQTAPLVASHTARS
jgi:phosphohistidine phosphatase